MKVCEDASDDAVCDEGETVIANFTYDGDGTRVMSVINNVTTRFVGNYYEVTDSVVTKYYYAGASRIAMRKDGTLSYMLSDHLGSTSITTDSNGNKVSEMRYTAWGEVRYENGTTPTDYTYTGQFSYTADFGLIFYNARWYDPALGRFAQADTIIPGAGNPQAWDRYAYALNNPVKYNDPSGHWICEDNDAEGNCIKPEPIYDRNYTIGGHPSDPSILTPNGKATQQIFIRLSRNCGWWNDDCTTPLTYERFIAIMINQELWPFTGKSPDAEDLKTAAANWFYQNCIANNQQVCAGTENAVLSWLGGALESVQKLFPGGFPENYDTSWHSLDFAKSVTDAILSRTGVASDYSGVIHWANRYYYIAHYGNSPPEEYMIYESALSKDDFFLIPYWVEVDLKSRCPSSVPCSP